MEHSTASIRSAQLAEALADKRFSATDPGHPAVAALRDLCAARMAARLEADPLAYAGVRLSACGRRNAPEASQVPAPGRLDKLLAEVKLPPLPQAYARLQEVMADPGCTATDLAEVVALDPRLTSSLLRLVNSPMFSLRARVDSIPRAVAILGQRQVSGLALGSMMISIFRETRRRGLDLEGFWRHSVACGTLARALAAAAGLEDPERHFSAGILHDTGQLCLLVTFPDDACKAVEKSFAESLPLNRAEWEVFGLDHGVLGQAVLGNWNLPPALAMAAGYHHVPDACKDPDGHATAVTVHLAEIAAKSLGFVTAESYFVSPLSEAAWRELGLSVEAFITVVRETEPVIEAAVQAMLH